MIAPQKLRALIKEKPIAIFGWGVSGRGAHALAQRMGTEATVFDEKELEGTRQAFGRGDAHQHSIVVLSPGFRPDHPWVLVAQAVGLPILNELDFGALFLSRGVYAVTGTDGKTTTTEFLAHTLNIVGQTAVAVGNNGRSLCAWLAQNIENEPATRLVVEISSAQAAHLQYLKLDGLLWTNFATNHLDVHGTMEDYFAAKWHLVDRLHSSLFVLGQSVFAYALQARQELPDFALAVANQPSATEDTLPAETVFDAAPFDENFRLCVAFGERIGIPRILFHQAAKSFQLPAHRMKKIGELGGISFYNDAKSSTFQSTLSGLKRFDKPVIWIGGGKSKGADPSELAKGLKNKVKSAYLIGSTATTLYKALMDEGISSSVSQTLENAVKSAFAEATRGDVILFSPAHASLDQFESFTHRGNCYEKYVFMLLSHAGAHTNA